MKRLVIAGFVIAFLVICYRQDQGTTYVPYTYHQVNGVYRYLPHYTPRRTHHPGYTITRHLMRTLHIH